MIFGVTISGEWLIVAASRWIEHPSDQLQGVAVGAETDHRRTHGHWKELRLLPMVWTLRCFHSMAAG